MLFDACVRTYKMHVRERGPMRPRNTAYRGWRNVIGPTKNGAETPGPHYRSRNEFSARCSIRAGWFARFQQPRLNPNRHDLFSLR